MQISEFQCLSPDKIKYDGVGFIIPPTLKDILQLGTNEYGKNVYDHYINLLSIDVNQYLSILPDKDVLLSMLSDEEKANLKIFDLWSISYENIKPIIESLSFFIFGCLKYDEVNNQIIIYDKDVYCGSVDRNNFDELRKFILKLNYISDEMIEKPKFKNKAAEELYYKLQQHEAESNKNTKKDLSLYNVVSSLCSYHNSINISNVWSLTVYQLYDQFFRQNMKNQLDISAMRWSTWGSESFDFDLWFKSLTKGG